MVTAARFEQRLGLPLEGRRPQRFLDRHAHGVELMVAGQLLGEFRPVVLEDDEIPHQIEQPAFLE